MNLLLFSGDLGAPEAKYTPPSTVFFVINALAPIKERGAIVTWFDMVELFPKKQNDSMITSPEMQTCDESQL